MKTYNKPLTFQVCTVHMLYIWGGKLSCSKLHKSRIASVVLSTSVIKLLRQY